MANAAPDTDDVRVAVHRIHGSSDRTIPCPASGVHVVPGGGHLINLTHADHVNDFIGEMIAASPPQKAEHESTRMNTHWHESKARA